MVTTPNGATGSVVPSSADQMSRQAATMRGCMHPYPTLLIDEPGDPPTLFSPWYQTQPAIVMLTKGHTIP